MSMRVAVSMIALFLAASAQPGFAQNHGIGGRIGPTITIFASDADWDFKTGIKR
jgi:hypothetical protein